MTQYVSPAEIHPAPCITGSSVVQDHIAKSMTDHPTGAADPGTRGQLTSSIGSMIRRSLLSEHSNEQERQFLPRGEMERILSYERVYTVLAEAGMRQIDVGNDICGKSKDQKRIKILTILLLLEKLQYIVEFLQHEIFDNQLPLQRNSELFGNWRRPDIDNFLDRQYVVLAPVLDFTTMDHKSFPHGTPMPFLIPLEWTSQGRHGQVCKVKIHDQHQEWGQRSASKAHDSCYAIKRFHMEANGKFEGERQALIRFSGPKGKHDNLIELFLSYGINDNQYLIFPWADGDLKDYWSRTQNDPTSLQHAQRLIGQCLGLAKGLCQVHHYHNFSGLHTSGAETPSTKSRNKGRHGDIKPKNILYFADDKGGPERLVIADFTLMRFHSDATTSFTFANQVGFSPTYRPPEVDERIGAIVSQKYDIWTLGCVYLEFVTWHLLGCDAVYRRSFQTADEKRFESFSTVRQTDDDKRRGMKEDKFFNNTRSGQVLKPSVKRWIKFLYWHPNCSPAIRAFLDLIKGHMLLPNPTKRYTIDDVRCELGRINGNCESLDKYATPSERNRWFYLWRNMSPPLFSEKSIYGTISEGLLTTCDTLLASQPNSDQDVIENAFKESPKDMIPGLEYEESGPSGRSTSQHPPIPQDFTSRRQTSNEKVTGENFDAHDFQAVESEPRRRLDTWQRRARKIRTMILENP